MSAPGQLPLMIVDDEEDFHLLLGRTLHLAGLENPIVSAADGAEALAYLQHCMDGEKAWPGVIFLDVRMPGISGFEVLKWLRDRHALGMTVVAMMTTSDNPKEVNTAFTFGAHTFLHKGIRAEILGPIVRAALKLAAKNAPAV